MNKAVFLDRDGVIIDAKKDFIYKEEDVLFLPRVLEALREIKKKKYLIIVITNQPAIARGITTEKEVYELHTILNEKIDNLIDKFYFCPHHPEMHSDVPDYAKKYRIFCNCRKPAPGMLLKAAEDFEIDLSESWMIGDMVTDIVAGKKAGCKTIMVKSPKNNRITKSSLDFDINTKPDNFAKDLFDAVRFID